jgi:hypothetical protein
MKFFFQYIDHLREPESVATDIDPAMLGNILHETMKVVYQPYNGRLISTETLNSILKNNESLSKIVNDAVNEEYKGGRYDSISGNELIVRDVLMSYLRKVLHTDKSVAPFTILNLEDSFVFNLLFELKGSLTDIKIGGKIDRIDTVSGITRIVDYKTGVVSDSIGSIDDLFTEDRKKDPDGWLQTLLYCEAYLTLKPGSSVRPSVYKIKKLNGSAPSDKLRIKTKGSDILIDNYATVRQDFLPRLAELIKVIFDENEPFVKTKDASGKCVWCPFRILCAR